MKFKGKGRARVGFGGGSEVVPLIELRPHRYSRLPEQDEEDHEHEWHPARPLSMSRPGTSSFSTLSEQKELTRCYRRSKPYASNTRKRTQKRQVHKSPLSSTLGRSSDCMAAANRDSACYYTHIHYRKPRDAKPGLQYWPQQTTTQSGRKTSGGERKE